MSNNCENSSGMSDSTGLSMLSSSFVSELNAEDLKAIHDAFHMSLSEDENFVNKDQFCDLLSTNVRKGSKEEYAELFDLVDISRDGVIDWNSFSSHLLLEYYEREDRAKTTQVPQWQDLKYIHSLHRDYICRIALSCSTASRYCTVSKDGSVCLYNEDFKLKRTCQLHTNPEEMRSKDLWVTNAIILPNMNKIAFSTTSKEIWIYDIASKNDFICHYKIHGLKFIPLCITYWNNPNNPKHSILAFGDTGGVVHTLFFSAANVSLFEKPLKSESGQDVSFPVHISSIIAGNFSSVTYVCHSGHSSWVRQIEYIPILDCFISCSTSSTDSIVFGWIGKSKKDMRLTQVKIPLGINCFDYEAKFNFVASAGINNHVCLWNPYVVSKPVGILRGHMQVIVGVQFIRSKCQLISLSKDLVMRVWDVNLQICLQRLTGVFPKGPDVNIVMFYDQDRSCLLTSLHQQLVLLKMKSDFKDRVVSHNAPVTDVVFNKTFDQVVSVCESSCINIWFLNTGQRVKHLTRAHGDAEITTVSLDHTQSRILSAGTDGTIKIWDTNGTCHHVLIVENGNPCEISQILYLKRCILAIGWSKVLCCFPTSQLKSYYLAPVDWKGKQEHFDDILAADFQNPRHLVTASYDGDIVFWNTNTQNSTRKIVTDKRSKRSCLPPLTAPRSVRSRRRSTTMAHGRSTSITCDRSTSLARDRSTSIALNRSTSVAGGRSTSLSSLSRQAVSTGSVYNKSAKPPTSCEAGSVSPSSKQLQSPTLIGVTSISYLKTRNSLNPRVADLYSCHSDGTIVFWNSLTCERIGDLKVFDFFGSIVSCVDSKDKYIGVAGETGMYKLWYIEKFCDDKPQADTSFAVNTLPPLVLSIKPHSDAITSIKFVEINGNLLTLTSSCDCLVKLHCFSHLIGIFGQDEHWNVNDKVLKDLVANALPQHFDGKIIEESDVESNDNSKVGEVENSQTHDETDSLTDEVFDDIDWVDNNELKEAWDETMLGKTYQEERKAKRDRKQPYQLNVISTNVSNDKHTRSYRCLKTKEINDVNILEKPDFILHPEKYFWGETEDSLNVQQINLSGEDVPILQHDEKSIFPKYILEMENRLRTAQKFANNSKQSQRSHPISLRKKCSRRTSLEPWTNRSVKALIKGVETTFE